MVGASGDPDPHFSVRGRDNKWFPSYDESKAIVDTG